MTPSVNGLVRRVRAAITGLGPIRRGLQRSARYGLLPSAVWARVPVSGPFQVELGFGVAFTYVSSEYDAIGRRLFFGGLDAWEGPDVRLFANLARKSRTVVDVGAHTGVYALAACAANPASRVVAFEPLEAPRRQLRSALLYNAWETRCEVRIEAAAARAEEARLYVPEHPFPSEASLVGEGARFELVETVRLDSLDCVDVDLVKIDVERGEHLVLEGMSAWFEANPPALLLEVLKDGPLDAIAALLEPYGYAYHRVTAQGPQAMDRLEPDPSGVARNVLALPPQKSDWI